jgi:aminoglycoside phosphotransferase (APT) family kinase protein
MTTGEDTSPLREGEGLDVAALARYLAETIEGLVEPLTVRQFPAGFSNLTYLVRSGSSEWVLRRPPHGTRPSSGHDMAREFRVLSGLLGRYPYAPEPVLLCEDVSVIGAPFYLARRIRGVILRREYPPGLPPSSTLVRAQQEALVDALAELHRVDFVEAGLASLGQPVGYVERQVRGWGSRYDRARTDDSPDSASLLAWLQANRPVSEHAAALLHNDYKLDNVVFDERAPDRLIGVLDWEMATLGDPRMDLGCSLAYWIEAGDPDWLAATRTLPTHLPGSLTRAEVLARYERATGLPLTDMRFFHAFGLFRLAVIAQQIYLRFVRGQTRDQRFAVLGQMVRALLRAGELVAAGRFGPT